MDPRGVITHRVNCAAFGRHTTNCCLAPDGRTLLITESGSGRILAAEIPPA